MPVDLVERSVPSSASRHERAWFVLVGALGIHVADEALTGFLDFYNPLVLSIRSRVQWFPMPTFSFGMWLAGLVALVLALAALGDRVRRGAWGTRLASWVLAIVMLLNGLAHLGGSVYFQQWLPGATSAPLLVAGALLLGVRTRERKQPSQSRTQKQAFQEE